MSGNDMTRISVEKRQGVLSFLKGEVESLFNGIADGVFRFLSGFSRGGNLPLEVITVQSANLVNSIVDYDLIDFDDETAR